jgi:hypothetical protein
MQKQMLMKAPLHLVLFVHILFIGIIGIVGLLGAREDETSW